MSSDYERKLIQMQQDIRESNSYLQDYMTDLNSWTNDIKIKEDSLKNKRTSNEEDNSNLPPIRNFIEPSKKKKKKKKSLPPITTTTQPPTTNEKIRAYDYRSWDKFDVDAECERIDTNEQDDKETKDEDETETTDEEWEQEVLKKKAEYNKECGNYQFKLKSYNQAIEYYTKAINCDSTNPIYFANRAQCQLLEQRYGACELDCTLAIQLDQLYTKAYYRRALARIELNKLDEAKNDLEFVLNNESTNRQAKEKYDDIMNRIKLDELKRNGRIYPIQKPVEQRSKKPLKHIDIEEIDTNMIMIKNKTKRLLIEEVDQSDITQTEPKKEIINDELVDNRQEPTSTVVEVSSEPVSRTKLSDETKKTNVRYLVPTTGFQFRRDWISLNNNYEHQSIYFNSIPSKMYSTLFSNGLDSNIFTTILQIWSNNPNIDVIIDSMYEMKNIKRFHTQLMFLSENDKQYLNTILQKLSTADKSLTEKVKIIMNTYKS
ncbi:unnamed protein product [Didymodactylos carnosus]|uniref:RNA polymerase II-associated protein 3 n=1 Tax=Didymodactylos carnosus TaxID=1234261 RepID=A0A813XTH9_9BILA|nr:unnamed protein product [Didymodactylos carnosus]CAF0872796.1 unnamed protein product [Didymodactylos carnosus]CAF3574375.1 unnamed protein product [Didymodactylos carnosus]CAF3660002.1 unnamed protein product [Didymodactylos carnosus]